MNNNGEVDAYYDPDLNITWLANANYAATQDPRSLPSSYGLYGAGTMFAIDADTWATHLTIDGITGWRLPTGDVDVPLSCPTRVPGIPDFPIGPGTPCFYTTGATDSGELTHLVYQTLGNMPGATPFNAGPFLNVQQGFYATSSLYDGPYVGAPAKGVVYTDVVGGRTMVALEQDGATWAWVVHDGDVAAIPEPSTYALMLGGLLLFGLQVHRTRPRST